MHREFRKLLTEATGSSEFVIAINADIREFTSFSKTVESTEVAMFIKRVYMKLIDEYFNNASFYKPTGDGLLVIIPYTEANLADIVKGTIDSCLALLVNFSSICIGDPMINFDVPKRIGIGISRGSACRLTSNDKILDYSGNVLNLSSRLMNLARPSGIVFDSNFGIEILSDETIDLFAKESVYINGIAEKEPIDIYYTKDYTKISLLSKHPITETKWTILEDTKTLKKIIDYGLNFRYELESKPVDPDQLKVKIFHTSVVRGKKQPGTYTWHAFPNFNYYLEAGKPFVNLKFNVLAAMLKKAGISKSSEVLIKIMYPELPKEK